MARLAEFPPLGRLPAAAHQTERSENSDRDSSLSTRNSRSVLSHRLVIHPKISDLEVEQSIDLYQKRLNELLQCKIVGARLATDLRNLQEYLLQLRNEISKTINTWITRMGYCGGHGKHRYYEKCFKPVSICRIYQLEARCTAAAGIVARRIQQLDRSTAPILADFLAFAIQQQLLQVQQIRYCQQNCGSAQRKGWDRLRDAALISAKPKVNLADR